jgi:pimeloyl-ACP methyl ester carboxylesterase
MTAGERLDPRAQLLAGVAAEERQVEAAGISTNLLTSGSGPDLVLLHGPGESSVKWKWALPGLARTHRVVAPDLPGHGRTELGDREPDIEHSVQWLDAFIGACCETTPVVVGHALGGALAARHAIEHGDKVARLLLVDSLGLGPFRPSPRFAAGLIGFAAHPTERSYTRFMDQCALDGTAMREQLGADWEPFVAYNLELAKSPSAKAASRMLRRVGIPRIPSAQLDRISTPTALIWGRHDRAIRLRVAEKVAAAQDWPLLVVDGVADDPARDRPDAFVAAVHDALARLDGATQHVDEPTSAEFGGTGH